VDAELQTWLVPPAAVYCNTPADFAYKLPQIGVLLGDAQALARHLRGAADIAFPVIHGAFGEDGMLGAALRREGVPFVGSLPEESGTAFNKVRPHMHGLHACAAAV
jgi:D-alanine-D-alanine ligase-like ATP-grasp enzyme